MDELKNSTLLVIAPHPDDEVIGCGGLIAKIKNAGGKVYINFLTVGDTLDFTRRGLSTQSERQEEIERVAKLLKFDGWDIAFLGNDSHLRLDTLGQKALMDSIERESPMSIEKIKPTIVAFPATHSYNQDHKIAAVATHAALRPAARQNKHFVETVLSYEEPADNWALNNYQLQNYFVELSAKDLALKIKAIKLYKSQDRPHPNMRSAETVRALAILRGSSCSLPLAEAYTIYRGLL